MTEQDPDQQGDQPAVPAEPMPAPPEPPVPPSEASGAVAADLVPRFLARLIDGLILWVVMIVIIVPIAFAIISSGGSNIGTAFGGGFSTAGLIAGIIWAAIIIGYFTYLESSRGQSVGKMIMKLKTEGPNGGNPTVEEAFKRNSWYALGIIPIIGGLAELGVVIYIAVTISQSATNTGWHDTFAGGTRVIKID